MSWPTTPTKANYDAGTDDPGLARAEIEALVDAVIDIINCRAANDGIASLGLNGKIPSGQIDTTLLDVYPIGGLLIWPSSTAPTGFLFCNGQEASRTTYAALYAVIGDTWGNGNGSTTFNLPDIRGRIPVGKGDMGGTAANRITATGDGNPGLDTSVLGRSGGSQSHALTTAQIPPHNHTSPPYVNYVQDGNVATTDETPAQGGGAANIKDGGDELSIGSNEAHPNVQPSIIIPYVIRY